MDVERLKKLAEGGDAQAALQLRERAKRTNDMELGDFLRGVREHHRMRLTQELASWDNVLIGIEPWVVLLDVVGPKAIQVIKWIRDGTGRDLRMSKRLVDAVRGVVDVERGPDPSLGVPAVVMRTVYEAQARLLELKLVEVGARVRVVPSFLVDASYYDDRQCVNEIVFKSEA